MEDIKTNQTIVSNQKGPSIRGLTQEEVVARIEQGLTNNW